MFAQTQLLQGPEPTAALWGTLRTPMVRHEPLTVDAGSTQHSSGLKMSLLADHIHFPGSSGEAQQGTEMATWPTTCRLALVLGTADRHMTKCSL